MIYGDIQSRYWQVGFLRFIDRPWYLFIVAMLTMWLNLRIIWRSMDKHFWTLGMFGDSEMLPHTYLFTLNTLVVLLFANTEIIARVNTTCPFYFYAWAEMITEKEERLLKAFKYYNAIIMGLNLLLFTAEIGFI